MVFAICTAWPLAAVCSSLVPQATQEGTAAEAHVGRGYEFEKDERFANAAAEFETALAARPELTRVRYQLGVCYFALGRYAEARREFERLRLVTDGDPSVRYFLGRLDLNEHQLEAAIRELQAIVAHPPFPDTAYYLGSAYLEKGDLITAEKWLNKAREANPRDFRIPDHLARLYQRQGRQGEAAREFARSAKLRQSYDEAAELGIACSQALEKEPPSRAPEACSRLFRMDDPERLTLLGIIYGQHGRYLEALEPLGKAAELDPDSYEVQHNLGLTFFRLKRYSEARGPLERAVALRPDFFDSNALLGATLYMLKQDAEAFGVLRHARQLNPQDSDTANLLFQTASALAAKEYAAQRYSRALSYLQVAEDLRPSDPQVHARLAEVYALMGERERAAGERRMAGKSPQY